jgi:hypothetical protein
MNRFDGTAAEPTFRMDLRSDPASNSTDSNLRQTLNASCSINSIAAGMVIWRICRQPTNAPDGIVVSFEPASKYTARVFKTMSPNKCNSGRKDEHLQMKSPDGQIPNKTQTDATGCERNHLQRNGTIANALWKDTNTRRKANSPKSLTMASFVKREPFSSDSIE